MDWKKCCEEGIVKEANTRDGVVSNLKRSSRNKFLSQQLLPLNEITAASKFSLAYEALRELLEALALQHGYKIYNHRCYTPFLKEILKNPRAARQFDALRKKRNAVNYYGEYLSPQKARELISTASELRNTLNNSFNET